MSDSDRSILIAVICEARDQLLEIEQALRAGDEKRIEIATEAFVNLRHTSMDWLGLE